MKFLVDMPLSPELAQWLRAEGHTAVHANELSMNRSPEAEILQAAARSGCVIITAGRSSQGGQTWCYWTRADSAARR